MPKESEDFMVSSKLSVIWYQVVMKMYQFLTSVLPFETQRHSKVKTCIKYVSNFIIPDFYIISFLNDQITQSSILKYACASYLPNNPDKFKVFIGNLETEDTNVCYHLQKYFPFLIGLIFITNNGGIDIILVGIWLVSSFQQDTRIIIWKTIQNIFLV